jgi:hypothetical protein
VVQDFDQATNSFSNPVQIFADTGHYAGWPFFTPDSKAVVFSLGNSGNFATTSSPPNNNPTAADLGIVDLATGKAVYLDAANGEDSSGNVYLPYGGRDAHLNFYPTVSPVATGGYFWVFFTSRRNYGNTMVDAKNGPASKKIWVSAVSIDAPAGTDPSHPAFYLPDQELASGNIRAFATLEPCKPNGATCNSGIDCCGGKCLAGSCSDVAGCSHEEEKCNTTSDCCNEGGVPLQCINNYCSLSTAQ